MKTSELTGPALDWAVAKCEGVEYIGDHVCDALGHWHEPTCFSAFWSQGGPIIERERIAIDYRLSWCVATVDDWDEEQSGPTPLIAAMRAYVASKLGDEVEVPEELKVCRPGCF